MKPVPPGGARNRSSNFVAYPPAAQLEEYAACPLLIARSEPIADASLPAILARSNPGIAIAAMMPMIATTISSSMRVNPFALRIFITHSFKEKPLAVRVTGVGATAMPRLSYVCLMLEVLYLVSLTLLTNNEIVWL